MRGLAEGAASIALVASAFAMSSCDATTSRTALTTPIGLHLLAPESVLTDATDVQLDVYDASLVSCTKDLLVGTPPTQTVLALSLTHCSDGVRWCGSGTIVEDASKPLVWSVVGTKLDGSLAFQGCTTQAVDQNPLAISIDVVAVIPGQTCGDGIVLPPETCDLGSSPSTEACDATQCETKEVIVSNGLSSNQFYRGNTPGRKTDVSLRWQNGTMLFALWSDLATGGTGGDGIAQLTARRLNGSVETDTSGSSILQSEVRVQGSVSFSSGGENTRSGKSFYPTVQPIDATSMLVTFSSSALDDVAHVYTSLQHTSLNVAISADQMISDPSVGADQPASALGTDGGILIPFVANNTIQSILRASDGTLGTVQTLSTSGTCATPRVAPVTDGYVVVWFDGDDIEMRHVTLAGVPDGTETIVNGNRGGIQDQPDIAALSTGGFLVAFRDGASASGTNIRVQKFDPTRTPIGAESAGTLNDVSTTGDHDSPAVAAATTADGRDFFLVVWNDGAAQQIAGRVVAGEADGFLYNPVDGSLDEFVIGIGAKPRSSPAVSVGGTPSQCVVGWVDENSDPASGDDDRVRVRPLPMPPNL